VRELETTHHIFQPPLYRAASTAWTRDYPAAIPGEKLTWDIAAVLSLTSFGYACGDRTLLKQVSRRPWLSRLDETGTVHLAKAPPHGLLWANPQQIASELLHRLENELASACTGRSHIYLLLSGGLDSRIVAGVIARLIEQGRISAVPTAITWGVDDSRDVLYAKAVADRLHFNWQHITFEPAHFQENVELVATRLGALSAPTHLHRMAWLKNIPPDAIVVAGSYGDSVGRGEFSGSSVLELRPLRPFNIHGLLLPEIAAQAATELQCDLDQLKARVAEPRNYAFLEIEQQAQYMRGMIAHVMSVINDYGTLYQAFTAPEVYGYMWSLHPSARTDDVYVELIRKLGRELIAIPWARTNQTIDKAIRPVVHYPEAASDYRPYQSWMAGELRDQVSQALDPEWFADTRLFDRTTIANLRQTVIDPQPGSGPRAYPPHHVAAWLWSFRHFTENVLPHMPTLPTDYVQSATASQHALAPNMADERSAIRRRLADVPFLLKLVRHIRKWWLRRDAKKRYPPD
jgi:asparagine synthase (glutamine-hydrolysing)